MNTHDDVNWAWFYARSIVAWTLLGLAVRAFHRLDPERRIIVDAIGRCATLPPRHLRQDEVL
jgi:hypothetical protein